MLALILASVFFSTFFFFLTFFDEWIFLCTYRPAENGTTFFSNESFFVCVGSIYVKFIYRSVLFYGCVICLFMCLWRRWFIHVLKFVHYGIKCDKAEIMRRRKGDGAKKKLKYSAFVRDSPLLCWCSAYFPSPITRSLVRSPAMSLYINIFFLFNLNGVLFNFVFSFAFSISNKKHLFMKMLVSDGWWREEKKHC